MRLTKIVTMNGDGGETLLAGKLTSKTHQAVELLGDIDELNSWLGCIDNQEVKHILEELQNELFYISAAIYKLEDDKFINVEYVEWLIERLNSELPPLDEFILPNNLLHVARAVCRRAERKSWGLAKELDKEFLWCKYLNRLSDLLFVLARYTNKKSEVQWNKGA